MFFGIRHSGNKTKAVYLVRTRALVLFMFSCLRSSPFLFCKHLVNFDVIGKYLVINKLIPLVSSPRQPKLRGSAGNQNCTLFLFWGRYIRACIAIFSTPAALRELSGGPPGGGNETSYPRGIARLRRAADAGAIVMP